MAQAIKRTPITGCEPASDLGADNARTGDGGDDVLVTDILFGSSAALSVTVAITAFFIYVWFIIPINHLPNGG